MVEPPDEELLIPLGKAEVKREGSDVSIICYAQTVPLALKVAAQLEEEDISAEIVDLRSIKPLDERAILDSVAKTHRVVIVEQDHPFCGVEEKERRRSFGWRSVSRNRDRQGDDGMGIARGWDAYRHLC